MLWPFAWLWAYSKPVLHQLAYGRDKHDSYYETTETAETEEGDAETANRQEAIG
jgi:CBS domain containing-hemolysin-like protein